MRLPISTYQPVPANVPTRAHAYHHIPNLPAVALPEGSFELAIEIAQLLLEIALSCPLATFPLATFLLARPARRRARRCTRRRTRRPARLAPELPPLCSPTQCGGVRRRPYDLFLLRH